MTIGQRPWLQGGFPMMPVRRAAVGLKLMRTSPSRVASICGFPTRTPTPEFTTTSLEADWGAVIEDGDPLINSPKHQLSLQVSQSFQVGGMAAQVGAGVQHTDKRLGFTADDFTLPSYTTARFFGQIKPTERFAIRLDLDNAFDEKYYTNSYADVWVEPGAPRRYRVTASYSL